MAGLEGIDMERFETSDAGAVLDTLLDRVEAGEEIVLLRQGRVAGRLVPPSPSTDRNVARRAAAAIKAMAKGTTLGGLSIRKLIDEGRA